MYNTDKDVRAAISSNLFCGLRHLEGLIKKLCLKKKGGGKRTKR